MRKLKNNYLYILFFLMLNTSIASVPTVEGLFRNTNNPDFSGDLIVLKALVEREEEIVEVSESVDSSTNENISNSKSSPLYIKLILNPGDDSDKLIEAHYSSANMSFGTILRQRFIKDMENYILEEGNLTTSWFYGLMHMYLSNKSSSINQILKKTNTDYLSNEDILNKDKLKLLTDYKNYLEEKKKKDDDVELESPLKPSEPEEYEKVKDLLKQNLYVKNSNVELQKFNNEFAWSVKLENLVARFSNFYKRLKFLEILEKGNKVTFNFGKYILFDGEHELPKFIYLNNEKGIKYKIQILSLSNFVNKSKTIEERALDYSKNTKKEENRIKRYYESNPNDETDFLFQ